MSWFILIGSGWTYSDHSNETPSDPFGSEKTEKKEEHRTGVPDRNHDWILDQHLAVGKKRGEIIHAFQVENPTTGRFRHLCEKIMIGVRVPEFVIRLDDVNDRCGFRSGSDRQLWILEFESEPADLIGKPVRDPFRGFSLADEIDLGETRVGNLPDLERDRFTERVDE